MTQSNTRWLNRLVQRQNRLKTLLFFLGLIAVGGFFLWWISPAPKAKTQAKASAPALVTTTEIADFNQSATGEALSSLQSDQSSLQRELSHLSKTAQAEQAHSSQVEQLQQSVNALKQQMTKLITEQHKAARPKQPTPTTNNPSGALPNVVPHRTDLTPEPTQAPMTLASLYAPRAFQFDYSKPASDSEQGCTPQNCVLPGTFAKAVLLGAADANASVNGESNTTPILFRLLDNGVLPNGYHSALKGCFVVGEVYGDISSERGEVKLSTISCIKHGKTITKNIDGTAYDIGGKEGVRGHPVMRNGKLLAYAGASGFLSGIGSALQQQYTTQSISPLGATSTVNNNKVFQYGAAKGAETALDRLSGYYIKRADQFHPIIEINAGSVVDLVFLSQFQLVPDEKPAGAKPTRHLSNQYWSGQSQQPTASLQTLNHFADAIPSAQVNRIQSQMSHLANHVASLGETK